MISKFDHNKPWAKLYGCKRWHQLRAAVLRRDPVCKECRRQPSEIADHKVDHRGDKFLFYDIDNLQGLCKPCHDKKTGSQHGTGERNPSKPGVVDGKVVDYAPKAKTDVTLPKGFDFLKAVGGNSVDNAKGNDVDLPKEETQ